MQKRLYLRPTQERCQSDRMCLIRNQVYCYRYRGFESLPLRKANKNKSFDKLKVNLVSHFVGNYANAIPMMLHTHFIKDKVPM
jgi:hypothetical protein